MKIRTGFVSNSSSSSFCMAGVFFGYRELTDEMIESLERKSLDIYSTDAGEKYVGLDISRMKGDETMDQFKSRALSTIRSADLDGLEVKESRLRLMVAEVCC